MLLLSASTVQANGALAVRIEQTLNETQVISILSGIDRGRQLVHHKKTVSCVNPAVIRQRLELAKAKETLNEIAVYEAAQKDLSQGNVDAKGQCESFTHKYGIVDLSQSAAGFSLFVEIPGGSYIGRLASHPDHEASYTLILEDGSRYKKGLSGNHDDDMYTLGDILDESDEMFFARVNASIY